MTAAAPNPISSCRSARSSIGAPDSSPTTAPEASSATPTSPAASSTARRRGRSRGILGIAGLFALLLAGYWFVQPSTPPVSTVTRTPPLDPKPGDANNNDYLRGLSIDKAHRDAEAARATGQTTTPDMRAAETTPNVQLPAAVSPQEQHKEQPKTATAPATTPAASMGQQGSQRSGNEDQAAKEAQKAYREAMLALMAGWGSKASAAHVEITPEEMAKRAEQKQQAAQARADAGQAVAANVGGPGNAAAGRPKHVVMPALRWVTGRTKLATNTDSGGPVVAEITSGPLEGDRVKGTAQKHEDRLTVTMNELTLQDGRTVPVNAMLMAPDSKETAIASSVDHHYIPRIVLPTLAAGIQGLGQAFALSGSSVFSGPYGASQNYNTFNGGQLAGIAAGTAAGQLNQVLQQQTPKQSTVNLAAEVDVGIMFLAPVEDGP